MKKSKIIVPAMALIAFSSLASIAGSVAWFTANRQANISAGTYAVVKTTTNMAYQVTADHGTTVNNNIVSLHISENDQQKDIKLTDGSFNHKNGTIYTPNEAGSGLDLDKSAMTFSTENLDSKLKRSPIEGGYVYTLVSFNVSFTISFGAVSGDYGLYLNTTANQSRFESGVQTNKTAKGFRMAIIPNGNTPSGSGQNRVVFADLQSKANCKYVADNTNFTGTSYVPFDYDLIDSNYNAALPTSETTREAAIARPDFLGYFGYAASQEVTLNYKVVAWYEGTDPEIINREEASDYQSVAATLVFDAVKLNDVVHTNHTLSYNANGGSGSMSAGSIVDGSVTLASNGFTAPTGKVFVGWSTEEGATVPVYAAGQELTRLGSDYTMYAVWANTATFNANGGTGTMASVNIVDGKINLPACTFTKEDNTFAGWATSSEDAAAGTVTYADQQSLTGIADNLNLYAVWTPNA